MAQFEDLSGAGKKNITVPYGNKLPYPVTFTDDGSPVDLSGRTYVMKIFKGKPGVSIARRTIDGVLSDDNLTITFSLDTLVEDSLLPATYNYTIDRTDGGTIVQRVYGQLKIR